MIMTTLAVTRIFFFIFLLYVLNYREIRSELGYDYHVGLRHDLTVQQ